MIKQKEIITNFASPTMHFKLTTSTSMVSEESMQQHMIDFENMSNIIKSNPYATLATLDKIVEELSVVKNLKIIEITNPVNKNGFIFYLEN